jgi:cysteinyl-tRNA synthetase
MVQFGAEKMSKSLGNLITIKEALGKYSADALRIFVLSSHYRSPLTYSEEAIEAAERGAERLEQAAHSGRGKSHGQAEIDTGLYRDRFTEAMDDDFNTPQAIAALFDLAREINRASEAGNDPEDARKLLQDTAGVLGLKLEKTRRLVASTGTGSVDLAGTTVIPEEISSETDIENLIRQRSELRKAKKWGEADEIRAKLDEMGIVLEDTPDGTIWRRNR